jgi:AcrR family transcriptional regulator
MSVAGIVDQDVDRPGQTFGAGDGRADFSMRELASGANVSFATPFNQFGSKDAMMQRLINVSTRANAVDRVRLAVDIAVGVMLEEPDVNRAVLGWFGAAGAPPGQVLTHSKALWARALGDGEGLTPARRPEALTCLPGLLAFGFRGVLSFWTAGERSDETFAISAREMASALLLPFAE